MKMLHGIAGADPEHKVATVEGVTVNDMGPASVASGVLFLW